MCVVVLKMADDAVSVMVPVVAEGVIVTLSTFSSRSAGQSQVISVNSQLVSERRESFLGA
jgi:uncharacterized protein YlxW (UPF0749 family)